MSRKRKYSEQQQEEHNVRRIAARVRNLLQLFLGLPLEDLQDPHPVSIEEAVIYLYLLGVGGYTLQEALRLALHPTSG